MKHLLISASLILSLSACASGALNSWPEDDPIQPHLVAANSYTATVTAALPFADQYRRVSQPCQVEGPRSNLTQREYMVLQAKANRGCQLGALDDPDGACDYIGKDVRGSPFALPTCCMRWRWGFGCRPAEGSFRLGSEKWRFADIETRGKSL